MNNNPKKTPNRKIGVADTSKAAFREIKKNPQFNKEAGIVISIVKQFGPINSRQISMKTGIPRTNITRSLFNAVHAPDPIICEVYKAKCPITQIRVKFYGIAE